MPSVSALFRQPDLVVLSHIYLWVLGLKCITCLPQKYLIKQLSKLGFSVSYDEIIRFKQSSVLSTAAGDVTCDPFPGAFTQWVADNVDHNIRTRGQAMTPFHGMGSFLPLHPCLLCQLHQSYNSSIKSPPSCL